MTPEREDPDEDNNMKTNEKECTDGNLETPQQKFITRVNCDAKVNDFKLDLGQDGNK